MSDRIDYYFTAVSPFTWLGHQTLVSLAAKYAKTLHYRPFSMMDVWKVSEAVPPGQRSATRQRYRLIELQRVADFRGLSLNVKPAHFPTDPTLADLCVIAIQEAGQDPGPFLFSVGEAVWSKDQQIADEAVIGALLDNAGHDRASILAAAREPHASQVREANTQAAIEADAIGAPCYVYQGETFWGQDRLEYLDAMLASGRVAFKPE